MTRHVELVTIGDELLLGFTVDTNGAYLARRLAENGVSVVRRTAVGDDRAGIAATLREALDRTGAVITTGGLGPTTDDVTRDAVADAFGVDLVVDDAHVEWMQQRWRARFGRDMPASNRRQAELPRGARALRNQHGSALGAYIENDRGQWLVMLPGVPRELRGMTDDTLVPMLLDKGAGRGDCIRSLTLRTTGIAESLLGEQLASVAMTQWSPGLTLAYLPGVDGVDLRLTARERSAEAATAALDAASTAIHAIAGASIYGRDDDDLAAVFLARCRDRGIRVSVAESCTGGLLGARITAIPGSSDVFAGGVIAYDNAVKVRDLDVPASLIETHGAVSEEVVRAMAMGARARFGTELSLAITGVAGPGGGTPDKPVGTVWICAALGERVEPRRIHGWGDRAEVRYRAAQAAMDLARRLLAVR